MYVVGLDEHRVPVPYPVSDLPHQAVPGQRLLGNAQVEEGSEHVVGEERLGAGQNTTKHNTALFNTTQHSSTQHNTIQHSSTQYNTIAENVVGEERF